jgi:hypothetical protein
MECTHLLLITQCILPRDIILTEVTCILITTFQIFLLILDTFLMECLIFLTIQEDLLLLISWIPIIILTHIIIQGKANFSLPWILVLSVNLSTGNNDVCAKAVQ